MFSKNRTEAIISRPMGAETMAGTVGATTMGAAIAAPTGPCIITRPNIRPCFFVSFTKEMSFIATHEEEFIGSVVQSFGTRGPRNTIQEQSTDDCIDRVLCWHIGNERLGMLLLLSEGRAQAVLTLFILFLSYLIFKILRVVSSL